MIHTNVPENSNENLIPWHTCTFFKISSWSSAFFKKTFPNKWILINAQQRKTKTEAEQSYLNVLSQGYRSCFWEGGFCCTSAKKQQCVDCTNRNTKYGTSQFICWSPHKFCCHGIDWIIQETSRWKNLEWKEINHKIFLSVTHLLSLRAEALQSS